MAANSKWRTRRLGAVLIAIFVQVVNGYEESFTISQLSPKSASNDRLPEDALLKTSETENLAFRIEPSALIDDPILVKDTIEEEEEEARHHIVARSADPIVRESRSLNIDELPSSNNEIDNELEIHNKRKYYGIHPTKTIDYLRVHSNDEVILSSNNFGDRLEFRFPGEGKRVPYGRALAPAGPRIRPTAVQPIFATASLRNEGRQNSEIQNIITGLVKLLNGNVNVQANTQLLRPGRPMASRINNRGPPRISDVPPLHDFEGPLMPPHAFIPTKTPPPYPFDRPPVHVNLPEQIVPALATRPALHRPMPPWQRPRPRPPNRRPNPGLPMYKPNLPILPDFTDFSESNEKTDEVTVNENETAHSENTIHHNEEVLSNPPEDSTVVDVVQNTKETSLETTTTSTTTTTEATTTEPTTTSTTTTTTTTTEKPTTTTPTTEKPKTDKPVKFEKEKEKKKETPPIEKDKNKDKHKIPEEKIPIKVVEDKFIPSHSPPVPPEKNPTEKPQETKQPEVTVRPAEKTEQSVAKNETTVIESSISESKTSAPSVLLTPTPTEGLITHAPTTVEASTIPIETSSINSQPLPASQGIPYHPYRPRPGIVLDDTDFKPHGSRRRPEASVITAMDTHLPGYGEIFDVTVSAIQGPGEKGGASVHVENVNLSNGPLEDDIIVSATGQQAFVSINGNRTYLNLFDTATAGTEVRPTRVHPVPHHSAPPPPVQLPATPPLGQGVAIPADDVPQPPVRRPLPSLHRPQQGYRRPQPTVRIDTCIVGDDSTCDQAQNEKCRTEAGISSCQCRPGYARRSHRDPCRRVVSLLLNLRVDRLYDRQVAWSNKLSDKESEPYQQLSYEAVRAIDSAFSMTPFSDDFVSASVNTVHKGDENNQGVFVNYTILMQETPETSRAAIATDIQKHILGVIRRRSNNVGASALWVDSVAGSVLPLHDVDECSSSDLNDCHQLATCSNTWGGFRCSCPEWTLEQRAGRECRACPSSHCSDRGQCRYSRGQPSCSCSAGYYGSKCEVDGEVVGVAVGASLAAALVIAATLAALLAWSRKWSREQKAGLGSPVFSYMAANTMKAPPVGQPPYQVTMEERLRWAQIAEAMVQANHYGPDAQTMATRPSSAMFGGYPTLPPVPLPRMGIHGHHNGTMNTVASRANTAASHHNLYAYTNHLAAESTSSEASSHVQERADLLVPRPKSRARSMHNQTGIYYDVDYENAPEPIYGSKGIPLSTYTVSRGPPFYRS